MCMNSKFKKTQSFKRGIADKAMNIGGFMKFGLPLIEKTGIKRAKWLMRESGIVDVMQDGENWLDVGTGPGHNLEQMILQMQKIKKNVQFFSVDPFIKPFSTVLKRLLKINEYNQKIFFRAGAQELPFDDASMDGISVFFVLHHIPPGDRAKVFEELKRVLKPNGKLIIIEDTPKDKFQARWVKFWDALTNGGFKVGDHHLSDAAWKKIFKKQGLTLISEKHFSSSSGKVPHTCFILTKSGRK